MELFNNNDSQNNSNINPNPDQGQPLVNLVNLITSNSNNENLPLNSSNSKDNNKNKDKNKSTNDEILMEIDKIIGNDDIDKMVSSNETIDLEPNQNQNQGPNYNNSTVQIKENHFLKNVSSQFNSYQLPFTFSKDTLNEPIITTIYRDLFLIYTKLKFVVNPFTSLEEKNYHIKQWDLWGPLLLTVFLACTLAINSDSKSQTVALVFIIFWIGSFLVYLNANLLGVNTSIFQIFCLLGYCLFPLNFSAIILSFTRFYEIIRFLLIGLTCCWSVYSTSSFLRSIAPQEQRYLVLYPGILLYIYISWFIFVTKH